MSSEQHPAMILHQLTTEFLAAEDKKQLYFRLLNRSISLCGYKRAVLFKVDGKRAKFQAVSGKSGVDSYSEMVEKWEKLASSVTEKDSPQQLSVSSFPAKEAAHWQFLSDHTNGLSVYWLPIKPWGKTRYVLWFERWEQDEWAERDLQLLSLVGVSAKSAFERLEPETLCRRISGKLFSWRRFLVSIVVLLAVLLSWRVPLRVVAPCEIIPEDPFIVTAPLSGVVSEVFVESGDQVKVGSQLFGYDPRVVNEELKIAQHQVNMLETTMTNTGFEALKRAKAKAELSILRFRLEQEKIRLQMAEYRASMLNVRADVPGSIIVDNPDEWRGRPVEVGQKVLMVVDPQNINLRIWLPEADNVNFSNSTEVKVLLNAFPDDSLNAHLKYVAQSVSVSPEGVPSVMAEGTFADLADRADEKLRIGLKGSAVLYGDKVSVAYWLLRKPWASARRIMGI
ncbi:HlyD family efflux transporter periplasmic adaptor subunit [Maridesulfovibrio sp.]|uniref:HlyD family efflux transporter periplasmic adaptor subunit n=1 Tax=Maridesulfovibrio sp. TaxID=2795000 RepID=UPI002A1888FD|nr:HlyD family efflux transporter periplasmic adaptor subunit [Maridesulfovibrio sp.]